MMAMTKARKNTNARANPMNTKLPFGELTIHEKIPISPSLLSKFSVVAFRMTERLTELISTALLLAVAKVDKINILFVDCPFASDLSCMTEVFKLLGVGPISESCERFMKVGGDETRLLSCDIDIDSTVRSMKLTVAYGDTDAAVSMEVENVSFDVDVTSGLETADCDDVVTNVGVARLVISVVISAVKIIGFIDVVEIAKNTLEFVGTAFDVDVIKFDIVVTNCGPVLDASNEKCFVSDGDGCDIVKLQNFPDQPSPQVRVPFREQS